MSSKTRLACGFIVALLASAQMVPAAFCKDDPEASVRFTLSSRAAEALRRAAAVSPCAVTALLYYLQGGQRQSEGVLYLDEIPSRDLIESMLEGVERGIGESGYGELPRNPYSGAQYFIAASWLVESVRQDSLVITLRAQLVDREGDPLAWPHEVEAASFVVISKDDVRFLGISGSRTAGLRPPSRARESIRWLAVRQRRSPSAPSSRA
jgi:hypothetical protein